MKKKFILHFKDSKDFEITGNYISSALEEHFTIDELVKLKFTSWSIKE